MYTDFVNTPVVSFPSSPAAMAPTQVIVVDWTVADYKTLIAGMDPRIPVIVLQPGQSGLEGLAKALAGFKNLDAIHLVTEGHGGAIQLGAHWIDDAAIKTDPTDVAAIGAALKPGGDLLLYGCSVAYGPAGQTFINDLSAQLGHVDVAASTNKTGPTVLSGDWNLEYSTGNVETVLPFTLAGMQDISHCLGCTLSTNDTTLQVYIPWGSNTDTLTGKAILDPNGTIIGVKSRSDSNPYSPPFKYYAGYYYLGRTLWDSGLTNQLAEASGVNSNSGNAWHTIEEFNTAFSHQFSLTSPPNVCARAVVSSNTAPTFSGTFTTAGTVNDNATTTPFANVTVNDADSGNTVKVTITYTAANGTLTGTGLTGSAGNYVLESGRVSPATLTTELQALVFTPTANQVAPTSTVQTTFTLTPNDGTADGTADATTKVTATSINDGPDPRRRRGVAGGQRQRHTQPVLDLYHHRPGPQRLRDSHNHPGHCGQRSFYIGLADCVGLLHG